MANKRKATALGRAESLLESEDYAGAADAAEAALGDPSVLSRAAVVRGKALALGLLRQIQENGEDGVNQGAFREPMRLFALALRLDPANAEAKSEIEELQGVLEELELPREVHTPNHPAPLDVIVVGAGASGVGVALMLTSTFGLDPQRVLLLERGEGVGETFRRWPKEMRFISPSFNSQGWTDSFDLNSVAYGTSPAFTLQAEHPTGDQYAFYLSELAAAGGLRVDVNTEVTAVRPQPRGGFEVEVVPAGPAEGKKKKNKGAAKPTLLRSRYVIWAAGEFQYPRASAPLFPGSELCLHNSSVRSWEELPGDDFVIIGGYESGMDAAFNLASCEKRCTVLASTAFWRVTTDDPSTELSPYTAERVRDARDAPNPPRLLAPLRVFKVERSGGEYVVHARWGAPVEHPGGEHRAPIKSGKDDEDGDEEDGEEDEEEEEEEEDEEEEEEEEEKGEEGAEISLRTPQAPLLCAGFEGSVASGVVKELFEWGEEDDDEEEESKAKPQGEAVAVGQGCDAGSPRLTPTDESTKTPGLFLAGPAVRHGELSFCFVYKFRQRFGVVADVIARGLGRDTVEAVEECRKMNMFLDDFACCKGACGETCQPSQARG